MSVKKTLMLVLVPLVVVLALILVCDGLIRQSARGKIYHDIDSVPHRKAALVLGTSSRLTNGSPNMYFAYRIKAASELFKAGKVDYLVVSGDNRQLSYNEPREMMRALIAAGVPENAIIMDFAGFRTLDSVVRMNLIFSQRSFIIVSQRFHIERAIFIAKSRKLDAIGYAATDVSRFYGLKTRAREYLARVKTFIDILTHKEPHFGGEKIEIPTRTDRIGIEQDSIS